MIQIPLINTDLNLLFVLISGVISVISVPYKDLNADKDDANTADKYRFESFIRIDQQGNQRSI